MKFNEVLNEDLLDYKGKAMLVTAKTKDFITLKYLNYRNPPVRLIKEDFESITELKFLEYKK